MRTESKLIIGLVRKSQEAFCTSDHILYKSNLDPITPSTWLKDLWPLQRFGRVDNPLLKQKLSQSNLREKRNMKINSSH